MIFRDIKTLITGLIQGRINEKDGFYIQSILPIMEKLTYLEKVDESLIEFILVVLLQMVEGNKIFLNNLSLDNPQHINISLLENGLEKLLEAYSELEILRTIIYGNIPEEILNGK